MRHGLCRQVAAAPKTQRFARFEYAGDRGFDPVAGDRAAGRSDSPRRRARAALAAAVLLAGTASAALAEGRWQPVENRKDCAVWNANPGPDETVTWTGPCRNGRSHGEGVKIWRYLDNGVWRESRYTGTTRNGRNHGSGVYRWANGNQYAGQWRRGLPHGPGVLRWPSGNRFEGHWRNGQWHGPGSYIFANGNKCEGEWRNGDLALGAGWEAGYFKRCRSDNNKILFFD